MWYSSVFEGTQMSQCKGPEPVSAKVSTSMRTRLDRRARQNGVCRAEFIRLVFDEYENLSEGFACPCCGEGIEVTV